MRHTDNRVQIELREELLLNSHLCVICSKEESIGKNDCAATVVLQTVHNNRHKQICRLAASEIRREVLLYAFFLVSTIRRIHKNNVKFVCFSVIAYILLKRVAVNDLRIINIVKKHISCTEQERKCFLLNTVDRIAVNRTVFYTFNLRIKHFKS